ncbi:MAG: MFS transporter [Simkania sp.]|nr:MFS transporter [Simkania sp.]
MRSETSENSHTIFPVYLAFLLDSFGLAVVYPLLTPLFLRPEDAIFLTGHPLGVRTALLGLTIGAFPLAQLFGTPMIGELSDRIGRKRSFIATIGGTSFGYFLTALGILLPSLPLLIVGRLWTGFFAGNLTLCLAAIADASPDMPSRIRTFGRLASLGGVSFILGILIGASLVGGVSSYGINPSLPFWLMAFFSLINLLLIYLLYYDPFSKAELGPLHVGQGLKNIASVFKEQQLRNIYLVYFFFMVCWVTSMQFVSTFLIQIYNASTLVLECSLIGVGLIWTLTNGFLTNQLSHRWKTSQVLLVSLPSLSLLLLLSSLAPSIWVFLSIFAVCVLCSALAWTHCLGAVSLLAEKRIQGRILGINQSIGALASMCGPVIGGLLASFGTHWIYLFTSLCSFIAFCLLTIEYINKKIS